MSKGAPLPPESKQRRGRHRHWPPRFAKISAVEGIALTDDMKRRIDEFDRRDAPADEGRRAIIDAHRTG